MSRSTLARGRRGSLAIGILLLGMANGCRQGNVYSPPPPPEVIVGTAVERSVTIYHDYTGNTEASKVVQVRARVSGYLEEIGFQDGSVVSRDQMLFTIDQRPYRAQVDQAKALLESRRATVVQQESILKRAQELLPSRAVTAEEVDINRGNYLVAKAGVLQAEAALRQAQLNLDYTTIEAPIEGRIGRHLVDVGNLITPEATLLTTIYQYDPMYAYFNASEANFLAYLKRLRAKEKVKKPSNNQSQSKDEATAGRTPIELGLANETGYPHHGYIDFSEATVDPNTGTILVRGVFANPRPYYLVPGLFVRLRVPIGVNPDALLVPEIALGTDQAGRFLLIVRPDNMVERRQVTVGTRYDSMRVIEEGLKLGERFIVEGLQRARPGAKVVPREAAANRQGSETGGLGQAARNQEGGVQIEIGPPTSLGSRTGKP